MFKTSTLLLCVEICIIYNLMTQATVVPTPSLQETSRLNQERFVQGDKFETSTEECSVDDPEGKKCAYQVDEQITTTRSNVKTTEHEHHSSSRPVTLDDDIQLKNRLENIDKLDPSLVSKFDLKSSDWLADGSATTLRQVLFIHRHGDRTPIVFPPGDDLAKEPFWNFHGLGQLTNRGKARLYLLGVMVRARYNKFLGYSVNKKQRISRSSGSLRCIESAQVFLSGFLALNAPNSSDSSQLEWDKDINKISHLWQPSSIQSVPSLIDGMLAEGSVCNRRQLEYDEVIEKSDLVKKIREEYKVEADILHKTIHSETDPFYKWFWASSLIEVERSYFPDKIKPEILNIYDRVEKAGELAMTAYQSTLISKRLRAGLLLSDMIKNMKTHRDIDSSGSKSSDSHDLKKFVHYSAHDLNLVALLGILDNWENYPKRPDYSSNIALELHEENNIWFIRIFYMPHVPERPIELYLKDCNRQDNVPLSQTRCTLDDFERLMRPYLIENWGTWMKECRNNFSSIDPYLTNL